MPETPSSERAARTSSSLKGLMIALISFIGLWLLNSCVLSGGDRSSQYAETVPTPAVGQISRPSALLPHQLGAPPCPGCAPVVRRPGSRDHDTPGTEFHPSATGGVGAPPWPRI